LTAGLETGTEDLHQAPMDDLVDSVASLVSSSSEERLPIFDEEDEEADTTNEGIETDV